MGIRMEPGGFQPIYLISIVNEEINLYVALEKYRIAANIALVKSE